MEFELITTTSVFSKISRKTLKRFKTVDVVFYLVEYRGCSIDDDITLDTFVPEEL